MWTVFFRAIPANPANSIADQTVRARFGVHAGHMAADDPPPGRAGEASMTENADGCRQKPT